LAPDETVINDYLCHPEFVMMKSYTPSEMETPQLHGLLLSAVAPRPIAFVSTVDENGRPNLAPFSFFNVFSANPPIAIFSPARRVRGNTTKHTLENAESTKECVINVVSYDILHQMNLASCEFEAGVNEFEKAGLTGISSDIVKPLRVKEAPVQLECKVREVIHLGEEGGAGNLVVSEVVRIHISDKVFGEDGNIDPQKLDLVARMGQNWYCRANGAAVFEVPKPGREVGIGVDSIPSDIRNSSVLTGNDLGKLGMVSFIPNEAEVQNYSQEKQVRELLAEYGSNPDQIERIVHKTARKFLSEGKVEEAWKMLLSLKYA
jgi:flavin reductase (DIM6/NTAB) family NADH-FMN oxidoreductase RutF